jgi:hypothetical protein
MRLEIVSHQVSLYEVIYLHTKTKRCTVNSFENDHRAEAGKCFMDQLKQGIEIQHRKFEYKIQIIKNQLVTSFTRFTMTDVNMDF